MSVSEPGKIITPWAQSGLRNSIPAAANPATGRAGFDQGFSAINMTAKEAGGIAPFGQDFNGIFYEVTNILRYMQAGGQPTFDGALASAIGGYPKGAVIIGTGGGGCYQNQVDSNMNDPDVNSSGWLPIVANQYPVGAPIPWPTAVPPPGFLAMTGQSFNATTYPKLAQAYPSLVLPDMRAEFIRGWDNGRGVDAGRAILSFQGDAIRSFSGSFEIAKYSDGNSIAIQNDGIVSLADGVTTGKGISSISTLLQRTKVTISSSPSIPSANENRVRSIAFNYIVRAA